jgi:SAM-dependent methyltransferase
MEYLAMGILTKRSAKVSRQWMPVNAQACEQAVKMPFLIRLMLVCRVKILVGIMRLGSRLSIARVAGLTLKVQAGGCNPAPLPGLSFKPLFLAAVEDLGAQHVVLDMGSGSGVWGLLAAQMGAEVTASDLSQVSLDIIAGNAQDNGVAVPELHSGDLFEPLAGRRFDRILFNPPFHLGNPNRPSDSAYVGGEDGDVVKRFLAALPEHLMEGGTACLILPGVELNEYEASLSQFEMRCRTARWMPLLGTVYLLELRVP